MATGSGTTTFTTVSEPYTRSMTLYFPDIAAVSNLYAVLPVGGTVTKIYAVVNGSVNAATILTPTITSLSLGGTMTFSASAPEGTVIVFTPTTNNVVVAGQVLKIASDGGATISVSCTITVITRV